MREIEQHSAPTEHRTPEQAPLSLTDSDTFGQMSLPNLPPAKPLKNTYDYSAQSPLKTPQERLLLKALRDHPNGITTTDLQTDPYNICHPPARAMDLRKAGYNVVTYQDHFRVGKYVLFSGVASD